MQWRRHFLQFRDDNDKAISIREARQDIENTRPTARNLFYAVERVYHAGLISAENAMVEAQKVDPTGCC